MRKAIINLSLLLLANANIHAQQNKSNAGNVKTDTQCEQLKKENDSLKKALGLNEPILSYTKNDIEYRLVKASGDKKTQIITIELVLTNKIENRIFELQNMLGTSIKIFTLNGDMLSSNEQIIHGATMVSTSTTLFTDTPLKLTFKFEPLLPSNEYLKLFFLAYKLRNLQDYRKDISEEVEFKDLKINWR